jgi:hypothetical protein
MANGKRLWQKNRVAEVLKMANTEKRTNTEVSCVSCGEHYETDTKGWGK